MNSANNTYLGNCPGINQGEPVKKLGNEMTLLNQQEVQIQLSKLFVTALFFGNLKVGLNKIED